MNLKYFFVRSFTLSLVFWGAKGYAQVKNDTKAPEKQDTLKLKEVKVVSTRAAVTLKGDTVVYNAPSFKTRPNATVEELIKALPGLEVDRDGNITYQGRPIQYISVNGRQYFLNDPKLISKNLFSDMVSKVELFDAPGKESKRTGIKDQDPAKALNLVLKKGVSLAINGKIYAGLTEEKNYTAGANASSFVGDRVIVGNLNSNNLSDLYAGQEKLMESPAARGRSTITGGGGTYADKLGSVTSINMNYGSRWNNDKILSGSNVQTFYGDSTTQRTVAGNTVNTGFSHTLAGEVQLLFDTTAPVSMNYKPAFSFSRNKSTSTTSTGQYIQSNGTQYLSNTGTTNNTSDDRNTNIANDLVWIKNFKDRSLVLSIGQQYAGSNTDGILNAATRFYDPKGVLLQEQQTSQQFRQSSTGSDYNFNLSDHEKLTETKGINFTYGLEVHRDAAKRTSYDFNALTKAYDLPDSLTTNDLKNRNTTQDMTVGYSWTGSALNYNVSGGLQYIQLGSEDLIKGDLLTKGFLNWTANASLNYIVGRAMPGKTGTGAGRINKTFSLDYHINSKSPSLTEWRPLADVSDPLFIRTGNPNLKPEQDHTLNLRYSAAQLIKGKALQLNVTGRYRADPIVSAVDLLPDGVQRSGYVNAGGLYDVAAGAIVDLPLGNVRNGKLRITNTAGYQQDMSLVNGAKNRREGLNAGQQFNALYRQGGKLEIYINGGWKYDNSHYSLQPDRNTASLTQNYRAGFSYDLPWKINLSSNYGINLYGAQAGLPATHAMVWNAALVKNVFKNDRGEFRFIAFDLLDSNNGITQRATGDSIYRNETNTPGRQLLLTFAYYIRSSGQL